MITAKVDGGAGHQSKATLALPVSIAGGRRNSTFDEVTFSQVHPSSRL
jgi:hypothetical protein